MQLRKLVDDDRTGTVKNMLLLVALWAVAGGLIGAFAVLMTGTGCAAGNQIARDVGPRVVELTAEECVKIATRDNRPDLASLCATIDDLAPFLDLIMAQQKARLAREADGGAPSSSQPVAPPPAPPSASSAPALPSSASPSASIDPCAGK